MTPYDAPFVAPGAGHAQGAIRPLHPGADLTRVTGPHPIWGGEPTSLHLAVESGRRDVAALLLKAGADPNHRSDQYDGWTPLLIAAGRESQSLIELLLAHGATVDAWAAAALGDVDQLRAIIHRTPDVILERRANGAPPLHFAGTVDAARLLVDRGAPLGTVDKYGATAARSAAYGRRSRRPVATFLMERSGESDPWLLAALDDAEGLRALDLAGVDVAAAVRDGLNPANGTGEMPIHTAAALGNVAAVEALLASGANANAHLPGSGARPLHYAARLGAREVVDVLLAAGADPRLKDEGRHATASDWARFFGRFDLAEYLELAET